MNWDGMDVIQIHSFFFDKKGFQQSDWVEHWLMRSRGNDIKLMYSVLKSWMAVNAMPRKS